MAISTLQTLDIIEVMENFLTRIRPAEHLRKQLDIGYKIEGQSIIIFEIRPQWNKPEISHEYPFAKTTFVKSRNNWNVFWRMSDLKWHSYPPKSTVKNLPEFTKLIEEDKHHYFFG